MHLRPRVLQAVQAETARAEKRMRKIRRQGKGFVYRCGWHFALAFQARRKTVLLRPFRASVRCRVSDCKQGLPDLKPSARLYRAPVLQKMYRQECSTKRRACRGHSKRNSARMRGNIWDFSSFSLFFLRFSKTKNAAPTVFKGLTTVGTAFCSYPAARAPLLFLLYFVFYQKWDAQSSPQISALAWRVT